MEIRMEKETCASIGTYGRDTVALPEEMGRNGENKHCPEAETIKQAGEIQSKWDWIETDIWTKRMLTALEEGVKGNVWFSLIDKVYSKRNLEVAARQILANRGSAGVDHVTVEAFARNLEGNIEGIQQGLKEGSYRPQTIRRVHIPKVGSKELRPLGIPTVRDRVVQAALRQVIEPIFEHEFAESSYGFRPCRGCKDALRQVERLLKTGYEYVVDADIKRYFDTISHKRLMEKVEERIADGRVNLLIAEFLKQRVLEELREWQPEEGTPQGGAISPLLANIYLNELDHEMERIGYRMIRYADDFVVMCRSKEEAEEALWKVKEWMETAGLELHATKTRIVDMGEIGSGFDFLGYHFERTKRSGQIRKWPSAKTLKKMKDAIREKTKRCNGSSLGYIIARINRQLKGWYEYFKHSYRLTFEFLDKWIRMRLRSILRKRRGGHGRGRGNDHFRWPNRYFTERGLFSLDAAHSGTVSPL